ncbi:MAG: hypothetical protein KAW09_09120 [Thermoplasmata archaeon]|nr:hypothetical protein [Thermoplasmata archaeon]
MNDRVKAEVIWSALRDLHSNETLERAVGRYVRNLKGSYEDYLSIISTIRKFAKKKKLSLLDAAKKAAESYQS